MINAILIITLAVLTRPPAPDTLVICPSEFRPALTPWEAYRRGQGHEILVVEPPDNAAELRSTIHRANNAGQLKFLVLVGDVPSAQTRPATQLRTTIPTNYLKAKINTRWGSEPTIASDIPYADLDGDEVPDLAVGRIPVDSAAELAIVVRKILSYEQATEHGAWERRLCIASGSGGFGAMTDAIIEAVARQVLQQLVPAEYETCHLCAGTEINKNTATATFSARVRQQLSEGSLAWIYMGHGRPTELDHVPTPTGDEPILSVGDVPQLRCSGHSPLAVLVACYTGAIDARRDCLAEELLKAEEGPVAVVAATRVTMPYGNTVLGCELLRACFHDPPGHLGDTLRLAEQKTLEAPPADDQLRASLDAMAGGLSPPPVDLADERREHVLMYHLYGDPLLHLRRATKSVAQADGTVTIKK